MSLEPSPKMTAAMELTRGFVAEGKSVLRFSPLTAPLDAMSELLTAADVRNLICDGRLSPKSRAEAAAQVQCGIPAVAALLP